MSLHIWGDLITSDLTDATAVRRGLCGWTVTGYAGRQLTRNQAISALTIAEERAKDQPNDALILSLESELAQ